MKKIFSYGIVVLLSALLLTGCTNGITVNNNEIVKFDGGTITKTESYNQMITTASYDKNFKLVKSILTKVDMQLLSKEGKYTAKLNEEAITKEMKEIISKSGEKPEEAFKKISQETGITVANEDEVKNLIRYQHLINELVIDKGPSDDDINKYYEQRYGEKVGFQFIGMNDKAKAEELQKELVTGTVKIEEIQQQLAEFKSKQQTQAPGQQQAEFVFKEKYTILTVQDTGDKPLFKKTGLFKDEDEANLFDRKNKDVWMAPIELQNKQQDTASKTDTKKQYLITKPSQYKDAEKQLNDALKAEIKSEIGKQKLSDPTEVEKVMREYRKSKGFEIHDEQLKKAFDAYEKTIDTPVQNNAAIG